MRGAFYILESGIAVASLKRISSEHSVLSPLSNCSYDQHNDGRVSTPEVMSTMRMRISPVVLASPRANGVGERAQGLTNGKSDALFHYVFARERVVGE
jgi:hypothetical protein